MAKIEDTVQNGLPGYGWITEDGMTSPAPDPPKYVPSAMLRLQVAKAEYLLDSIALADSHRAWSELAGGEISAIAYDNVLVITVSGDKADKLESLLKITDLATAERP